MVTSSPSATSATPGGLTIREASEHLGMSASTVRRKIKAGTLPAIQVPTTQGHEWRVFPQGGAPTTGDYVVITGEYLTTNGEQLATSNDQIVTSTTQGDSRDTTGEPQTGDDLVTDQGYPPEMVSRSSPAVSE